MTPPMLPSHPRWDRVIILGCPFVVVAVGALVTDLIGRFLAETVKHMWWDFGPFLVLSSWVTFGIAVASFLALDAARIRNMPERRWRGRRQMAVATLASAGLGLVSGLAVAIVAAAVIFELGVNHLVPEWGLWALGVVLCLFVLAAAINDLRVRWGARFGERPEGDVSVADGGKMVEPRATPPDTSQNWLTG